MAYVALYRKWRPMVFDDMVGQESVTTVLKNQIKSGKIAHAYLFSGGRGTGKTTTAKIMARAINCLNPKDGNPCNECEICKGILSGEIMDVVEMDAASNNGVDDVRQIKEEVLYTPTKAKYRVYIIDEVHMFSTGAFNALLKTLEEPPEHVVFILATTEKHKLPNTILSRCQRYEYKQINKEDIIKRLSEILSSSDIKYDEDALDLIASLADGAMRDAISILDQCISVCDKLTKNVVVDIVGIAEESEIYELLRCIFDYNFKEALNILNGYINSGKDVEQLVVLLTKMVRDVLIYKTTLSDYQGMYLNVIDLDGFKKLADSVDEDRLVDMIYSLSDLSNKLKWSTSKRILLEVELVKLTTKFSNGSSVKNIVNADVSVNKVKESNKAESKVIDKKVLDNNENMISQSKKDDDTKFVEFSKWKDVVDKLKENRNMVLYSNMIGVKAFDLPNKKVGIKFDLKAMEFGKKILSDSLKKSQLEKAIEDVVGEKREVVVLTDDLVKDFVEPKDRITEIAKDRNIPINIIED